MHHGQNVLLLFTHLVTFTIAPASGIHTYREDALTLSGQEACCLLSREKGFNLSFFSFSQALHNI